TLSSGLTNTQVSWNHTQEFSASSRLTSNLNYVTSTTVQRQTALNAMSALATISSMLNYSRAVGPFSVSVGGTRRQYPGREQVDQDFPSVNVSSKAIHIGRFVEWTPGFNSSTSSSQHLDAQGDFKYRYFERNGVLDSTKFDRSTSSSTAAFNSPFKIGKFNLPLSISYSDRMNDFPEVRLIVNPADTSRRETRVYSRTYLTTLDWRTAVTLPTFLQGSWNVVPTVSIENVDPAGFWVRSERTGNNFVSQSKRLSWGVGVAPTFFGLSRWGVGPVARFRHSINPTLSWSYSPTAKVSDEFLAALGKTPAGYLGALAQNQLTLHLSQTFEAKLKKSASDTSSSEEGKKVKLLSMNFGSLTYDFERARATGKSGFATPNMNIDMNSELLPGLSLALGYSLFEGAVDSDTAKFSPYRESISASMQINRQTPFIRWILGLFGVSSDASVAPGALDATSGQFGQGMGSSQQIAGAGMRQQLSAVPVGRGFDASISLSATRQRPPSISTDTSRVKQYDATIQCEALKVNPIQYDVCVRNALAAPNVDYTQFSSTTAGGTFFREPPRTSINWRTSFDLTPKWAVQWSTSYDAVRKEFASHQVTLQRDLHDWRAMFGFTQAPNGNFAFTFFVSLKAEPDLKFNYDRASYRQSMVPLP
ncbi:MAG: putative LPS assembly protein LptD, partial [Gemmatimonadaceae bacterium]